MSACANCSSGPVDPCAPGCPAPREVDRETDSDGDRIACPVCRKTFGDLWEYGDGSEEDIETECPHCGAPILLCRHISVDYTCEPRKP